MEELNREVEEQQRKGKRVVGVLGCMAERLKEKLVEQNRLIDLVVGPDSYRDLPEVVGALWQQGGGGVHMRT